MKLHPVTHGPNKNRFCGPSALSALTGKTTDETSRIMRELLDRRSITGVGHSEMSITLQHLGFSIAGYQHYLFKDMTLARFLREFPRDARAVYLIVAGRHWQVVQGRRFVCGLTKDIVGFRHPKVKRRARISSVWKISR